MPRAGNRLVGLLVVVGIALSVAGVVGWATTAPSSGTKAAMQTDTPRPSDNTTPALEPREPGEAPDRTSHRTPEGNVTEIEGDPAPVAIARINYLIDGYRGPDEAVMVRRDADLPPLVTAGIDPFPNVCWGDNTVILVTAENRSDPLHRIEWDGRTIYLDRTGCYDE
jgi:hypothetical protein